MVAIPIEDQFVQTQINLSPPTDSVVADPNYGECSSDTSTTVLHQKVTMSAMSLCTVCCVRNDQTDARTLLVPTVPISWQEAQHVTQPSSQRSATIPYDQLAHVRLRLQ